MASIKQLGDRRFKITVSNGYRPRREEDLQSQDHSGAGEYSQVGHPAVCGSRGGRTGTAVQVRLRRGREYDIRGVRQTVAGPAGPVCPRHVGELSEDASKGISLHRGHPVEPAPSDCSGEYAGRTAEAEIPWQAHRGGHSTEIPDRGLRRPHQRQAESRSF